MHPELGLALARAWAAFEHHRPPASDETRLRVVLEHPPIPHASLLATLVSLRFTTWIRQGCAAVVCCCAAEPLLQGASLDALLDGFAHERLRYELRARELLLELSDLLEIDEPSANLDLELGRWRWMLHDYTRGLDARLCEVLEDLGARYHEHAPTSVSGAWSSLCARQKVDACLGLVLSYADAAAPRARSSVLLGFVDPLATDALGSPAWWCRWLVEAWDAHHPFGERMRPHELRAFVGFAWRALGELEPGLARALLQARALGIE